MTSAKEKKWLNEYLQCWNATEAARRADYKWPEKQGWQKKVKFADEIERRLDLDAVSASEVLYRLAAQARLDLGQFVDVAENGSPKLNWERLQDARATGCVKSMTQTKLGIKVEFHDAQAALVHLGRYHGLFTDKVKVVDWRDEIVELLRSNRVTPEQVIDEFGDDIGTKLVKSAS